MLSGQVFGGDFAARTRKLDEKELIQILHKPEL